MRTTKIIRHFAWCLMLIPSVVFGQEQEAKIELNFIAGDSTKTVHAYVTSEGKPVKDAEVKLYVKRLFSLLPIGNAETTDETGIANFEFPLDLPGDSTGNLTVIAKIEDNDTYGNAEVQKDVKWGSAIKAVDLDKRSISASRAKAPIYFIVASNLIIIGIWGTLLYIVFQVFKIKKLSSTNKKTISKS